MQARVKPVRLTQLNLVVSRPSQDLAQNIRLAVEGLLKSWVTSSAVELASGSFKGLDKLLDLPYLNVPIDTMTV